MQRMIPILCWLFLFAQAYGQDVFVPRELKAIPVARSDKEQAPKTEKAPASKEPLVAKPAVAAPAKTTSVVEPPAKLRSAKVPAVKADTVNFPTVKALPTNPHLEKTDSAKAEPIKAPVVKETVNLSSEKAPGAKAESEKARVVKESAVGPTKETAAKSQSVKAEKAKAPAGKEPVADSHSEKVQTAKVETKKAPAVKEPAANPSSEKVKTKTETVKATAIKEPEVKPTSQKVQSAKVEPVKASLAKEPVVKVQPEKTQSDKAEPTKTQPAEEPIVDLQLADRSTETASTRLADGFDFPVGKPEAEGYYKARGFRSGGHMGEDWDGVRGGDTDLKDPIYCIGNGIVVFARDVHRGWGNVVIVRHAFRENGQVKHIDSLYGHLHSILVKRGQRVTRGQQVGTMGTAHGLYDAHLHLEIRKNLEIGMSRAKFSKNFSNYYDPSQFIESHRHLSGGGASLRVAMNTFTHDAAYHFDDAPNYSPRKHSTTQSAAALKQALSNGTH